MFVVFYFESRTSFISLRLLSFQVRSRVCVVRLVPGEEILHASVQSLRLDTRRTLDRGLPVVSHHPGNNLKVA